MRYTVKEHNLDSRVLSRSKVVQTQKSKIKQREE